VKIDILNGPNLNLLGTRQPEVYGTTTLADIEAGCHSRAMTHNATIRFRQTNHEGELVEMIHDSKVNADGIILNAGAYTHTSVALHDALASVGLPCIEVHLSNIHAREAFRKTSFISPVANALVCGFGAMGYYLAIDGLVDLISDG